MAVAPNPLFDPQRLECRVGSQGGCVVPGEQLSPEQSDLVSSLAEQLAAIRGIKAVVLGGSYARGRARPGSDIDLGLLYSEAGPFSIASLRELAERVNDSPWPVVTDFYGWGPWVNGGAWLTVGGQRIDFLYRNLEQLERVIAAAEAGRYEVHYLQQPPFGFFSATYLGEIAVCVPLFDPEARVAGLKRRVAVYPEALRRAVVRDYLFMAEFGLGAFAGKFAARRRLWDGGLLDLGREPTGVGPVRLEPRVSDQRQDGLGGGGRVRARPARVGAPRAADAGAAGRISRGTRRGR